MADRNNGYAYDEYGRPVSRNTTARPHSRPVQRGSGTARPTRENPVHSGRPVQQQRQVPQNRPAERRQPAREQYYAPERQAQPRQYQGEQYYEPERQAQPSRYQGEQYYAQQNRYQGGQYYEPQRQMPPQNAAPRRSVGSAQPAKRKATRAQMRADRRRRAKENFGVFLTRLAIYGVVLLLLAGICAAIFFGFFYHTPDEKENTISYFTCFDGDTTSKETYSKDIVYKDGNFRISFTSLAEGCGMSSVVDRKSAKFVLPYKAQTDDSDGTGKEEYVIFYKDSTECEVSGQPARLPAPAVFSGKTVWVSADFVTYYMNGITVTEEDGAVHVTRDMSEDGKEPLEVSFALKKEGVDSLDPSQVDDALLNADVTFATDLSEYEKYMDPENAGEYLVLANKTNLLESTYEPEGLVDVADTRQDGRNTQQMRECAEKALEAMFIELREAGYDDVSVTSAYRSYDYQYELYESYVNREMNNDYTLTREDAEAIVDTYSARPGTSEHQTGLCCDMHNLTEADVSFAEQPAYKWLTENAWKFGFILRFPEDKAEKTGYSFEPWHYRFVGRTAARQIHAQGLCLEEYLENR